MSKKMKKAKKAKRENSWKFHVSVPNGVHPDEIMRDLSRKNPIALVSVIDNEKDDCGCDVVGVLINRILSDDFDGTFPETPEKKNIYAVGIHYDILNKATACDMKPPVTAMLNENSVGIFFRCDKEDFQPVIAWAKKVKYAVVPEENHRDITVTVSLPKI